MTGVHGDMFEVEPFEFEIEPFEFKPMLFMFKAKPMLVKVKFEAEPTPNKFGPTPPEILEMEAAEEERYAEQLRQEEQEQLHLTNPEAVYVPSEKVKSQEAFAAKLRAYADGVVPA